MGEIDMKNELMTACNDGNIIIQNIFDLMGHLESDRKNVKH